MSHRAVQNILESHRPGVSGLTLRRAMTEAWFSDTLAWLLDPRGDHGLGVAFLDAFMMRLAQRRVNGETERDGKPTPYARRATHLRAGRGGVGRLASRLAVGNAAVLREFFLAPSKTQDSRARFCDLVVLDLDMADGLFLVIENKLFTENHPDQLGDTLAVVEDRYARSPVREYVYLTLDGRVPRTDTARDRGVVTRWLRVSWLTDVLPLLASLEPEHQGCRELLSLLTWMDSLARLPPSLREQVERFRGELMDVASRLLLEELTRLCSRGSWEMGQSGIRQRRLVHSSAKTRHLSLQLLPNLSVTVECHRQERRQFEKVVLPFGAPAKQVFNLLDVVARDVYYRHFDKPSAFLAKTKRLTASVKSEQERALALLRFVHRRRFELQALVAVSGHVDGF